MDDHRSENPGTPQLRIETYCRDETGRKFLSEIREGPRVLWRKEDAAEGQCCPFADCICNTPEFQREPEPNPPGYFCPTTPYTTAAEGDEKTPHE